MFRVGHVLVLPLVVGLSACVSPKDYETTPVEVTTSKGTVTCQLYTQKQVFWDRAINRPNSMSVAEADAVCINEGKRRAGLS